MHKLEHEDADLEELAIQEMIDCMRAKYPDLKQWKEDEKGCFPLSLNAGLGFIKEHGLCREESYPFIQKRGECRSAEIREDRLRITDFKRIDKTKIDEVKRMIDTRPVAGAIEVDIRDLNLRNLGGVSDLSFSLQFIKSFSSKLKHKSNG